MFVVRSLIGTTIKPLLGRFVKGGVQIPNESESSLQLNNLVLREDTIEELLKIPHFQVETASVTSVHVNIGRNGIGIKWDQINITAKYDKTYNCEHPHDEPTDVMGSSLLQNSASVQHGSSFDLPDLVNRIGAITDTIVHSIPKISLSVSLDDKHYILLLLNCEYSDLKGLSIQQMSLSCGNDQILMTNNITSSSLKQFDIDSMNIHPSNGNLKTLLDLIDSITENTTNDNPDDSAFSIGVFVNTTTIMFGPLKMILTGLDFSAGEIQIVSAACTLKDKIVGTMNGLKFSYSTSCDSQLNPETVTLFDEDKIFMYHESLRPAPIGSDERTQHYRDQTLEMASQKYHILCESVLVNFELITHVIGLVQSYTGPSTSKKTSTFAVNIQIERKCTVSMESVRLNAKRTTGSSHCGNFFVDNVSGGIHWYLSLALLKLQTVDGIMIAMMESNKVGGFRLERIAASSENATIGSVEELQKMIPTMTDDGEQMDICVHITHAKIQPNKWFQQLVLCSSIDVFTVGKDLVVIAGTVETTHLRGSGLQIQVGETGTVVRIAILQFLADKHQIAEIKRLLALKKNSVVVEEMTKVFNINDHTIIRNYQPEVEAKAKAKTKFKLSIAKLYLQLRHNDWIGHVELSLDGLKVKVLSDRTIVSIEYLTCLSRLKHNETKRVLVTRRVDMIAIGNLHDYVINFAEPDGVDNITLNIDPTLIDFLTQYIGYIQESEDNKTESIRVRSLKVTPFKIRLSYKPGSSSLDSIGASTALRWIPISNAAIKVKLFECFGLMPEEIGIAFGMHLIEDRKNLARLAGGVKLIRAPADVMRNVTELILVPTTAMSEQETQSMLSRVQTLSAKTIVSVLSVGAASSRVQPSGIKQGIIQAGQVFQRDMNTVIAFVSGDTRSVDLLELPMMIIRPVTSPISTFISGVCNQLDQTKASKR